MTLRAHHMHCFMLLVLVLLVSAMPALAQPPTLPTSDCDGYVGLTNRIAGCIRESVDSAAQNFFDQANGIYPYLKNSILGVLTLAVTIYGVLMALGMVESITRDSMVLLFKIAAVAGFTASTPQLHGMIINMMDSTATTVVSYAPPQGPAYKDSNGDVDFDQGKCMQLMVEEQAKSAPGKPVVGPWLGMDCLLDTVIGIKKPNDLQNNAATQKWFNDTLDGKSSAEPTQGMNRTYLYLFFSGMQTSVMGLLFAVTGAMFIWGLLMLIIKTFYIYIGGYIGVTMMVMLSPLFIPLILFKVTNKYFEKWVKVTLSFALQPIISLVFIIFSLTAIDFAAFSGDHSIMYRMAGDAIRADKFDMNDYLKVPRAPSGAPDTANPPANTSAPIIKDNDKTLAETKAAIDDPKLTMPAGTNDSGGLINNAINSACTEENMKNNQNVRDACSYRHPISITSQYIDWDKMAAARNPAVTPADAKVTPGQQIANEVLSAAIFAALVVFVMNGLLALVPFMAYDLLGDFNQSPNLGVMGQFNRTAGKTFNEAATFGSGIGGQIQRAIGIRK